MLPRRAHRAAPLAARAVARCARTHWRLAYFLCVRACPDMPGLGLWRTPWRAAAELMVQAGAMHGLVSARRARRCARRRPGRGGAGAWLLAQRAHGHRRPVPPYQPHAGAHARRQPLLALHPIQAPSSVRLQIPALRRVLTPLSILGKLRAARGLGARGDGPQQAAQHLRLRDRYAPNTYAAGVRMLRDRQCSWRVAQPATGGSSA